MLTFPGGASMGSVPQIPGAYGAAVPAPYGGAAPATNAYGTPMYPSGSYAMW